MAGVTGSDARRAGGLPSIGCDACRELAPEAVQAVDALADSPVLP